jgi:preprotein translocase subunit Sec61beta
MPRPKTTVHIALIVALLVTIAELVCARQTQAQTT